MSARERHTTQEVPPWVIRYAYNGVEYLALIDREHSSHEQPSNYTDAYAIETVKGFEYHGQWLLMGCGVKPEWEGCFLAEAHQHFEEIEEEWRKRHER